MVTATKSFAATLIAAAIGTALLGVAVFVLGKPVIGKYMVYTGLVGAVIGVVIRVVAMLRNPEAEEAMDDDDAAATDP